MSTKSQSRSPEENLDVLAEMTAAVLQEYPELRGVVVNHATARTLDPSWQTESGRTLLGKPLHVNDWWPHPNEVLKDDEVGFVSRLGGVYKRAFLANHTYSGSSMRRQRRGDGRGGKSLTPANAKVGMQARIAGGRMSVGTVGTITKVIGDTVELTPPNGNPLKVSCYRLQEWEDATRSRPPIGLLVDRVIESCAEFYKQTMRNPEFVVVTIETLHDLQRDVAARARVEGPMSSFAGPFTGDLQIHAPGGLAVVIPRNDPRVSAMCLEQIQDYQAILVPEKPGHPIKFHLWDPGTTDWREDTNNKIATQKLIKRLFADRRRNADWNF